MWYRYKWIALYTDTLGILFCTAEVIHTHDQYEFMQAMNLGLQPAAVNT